MSNALLNFIFITIGALAIGVQYGWLTGLGIWLIAVSIAD
jgi:hypothetical protein